MKDVKIVRVEPKNVAELQNIGRDTFVETFSAHNTKENMAKYVDETFSLSKLTAELKNELSQFYFAILDDEVVGYLKLNVGLAQTEVKADNALEIERIYVSKAFQGKNVGQLLYNKAIVIAQEAGVDYIWLAVWEQNFKAIGFYKKNGFVEFDKHIFRLGLDEQIDLMMKKTLENY